MYFFVFFSSSFSFLISNLNDQRITAIEHKVDDESFIDASNKILTLISGVLLLFMCNFHFTFSLQSNIFQNQSNAVSKYTKV